MKESQSPASTGPGPASSSKPPSPAPAQQQAASSISRPSSAMSSASTSASASASASTSTPATRPEPSSSSSSSSSARRPFKRDFSVGPSGSKPVYMQSGGKVMLVRRVKRKSENPMKQLKRWLVQYQVGLSFNLITLLLLVHACMPKARPYTSKFFTLSYYNTRSDKYGLGSDDYYVISLLVVLFTGLRAAAMDFLLAPFAKSQGLSNKKATTRFAEQGWLLIYYIFFWSLGVYLYVESPYYLNLRELWTGWPDREITGVMKAYVLAQLSFWLQQIIVINIEARRKDHWQMFSHHIVTSSLIFAAYRFHFTKIANLILVLMDVVDLFFPTAKCLKYLGYNTLCDIMFGVFMLSWLVARHIFYVMAVYSVWADAQPIIGGDCWRGPANRLQGPFNTPADVSYLERLEPLWRADGLVCFDDPVKHTFLAMLLFLQGLALVWFAMIVRVAMRVLRGQGADDTRSDDEAAEGGEDEPEEEEEIVYEEAQPLEEEVGVEQLDLKSWERRAGVVKIRQGTTATGVSLPGHSDRKELLGRIGCEKQVD